MHFIGLIHSMRSNPLQLIFLGPHSQSGSGRLRRVHFSPAALCMSCDSYVIEF